jgi:hypothetical protein
MNFFMGPHDFLATSCTLHFQQHHMLFHFQSPKDSVITSKNVLYNFGWSIALVVDCSRNLLQVVYKLWNKHMNDDCINFVTLQPIA